MSVLCSWDIFITLDSCFSEINWHSVSNLSDSEGDVKSQTFVYIRRLTRHTVRIFNRGTVIDKLSKRTSETTQWLKKKKDKYAVFSSDVKTLATALLNMYD